MSNPGVQAFFMNKLLEVKEEGKDETYFLLYIYIIVY